MLGRQWFAQTVQCPAGRQDQYGRPPYPDKSREGGIAGQIAAELRESIRGGRLTPGTRLPATRDLATDLQVSRGVVVEAYEQLVAEGFLVSRVGVGTQVTPKNATRPAPAPRDSAARPDPARPDPGRRAPSAQAFPPYYGHRPTSPTSATSPVNAGSRP
ncbi:GntR family transcriptional regulator [Nonomuraea thailandensis]